MFKEILFFNFLINFLLFTNSVDALNRALHCNCRSRVSNRIIGGNEVKQQDYPWQITLGIKPDTPWEIKPEKFQIGKRDKLPEFFKTATHICGGAILSSNLILTAGHCVTDNPGKPKNPKELGVGYGNKLNLVNIYNKGRVQVDKIYVHPGYNVSNKDTTDDIAIIRLAQPIDFDGEAVRPACLLQENGGRKNYGDVIATGWGSTRVMRFNYLTRSWSGYKASLQLKEATFRDVSATSKTCQENSKLVCIGPIKANESVCKGDSGGPLHYQYEGNTFLVGITSFGSTKRVASSLFEIQACAGEAGYTRVQSQLDWIKSIVDLNEICLFEQLGNEKIRLFEKNN